MELSNLSCAEVIARDLYGLLKAYEKVECRDDIATTNKKKSKIAWALREALDVPCVLRETMSVPDVDRAVQREFNRRKTVAKLFQNEE